MPDKTLSVTFVRSWQIYNAGETAVFPSHIAQAMSKSGICKIELSKSANSKHDGLQAITPVADLVKK